MHNPRLHSPHFHERVPPNILFSSIHTWPDNNDARRRRSQLLFLTSRCPTAAFWLQAPCRNGELAPITVSIHGDLCLQAFQRQRHFQFHETPSSNTLFQRQAPPLLLDERYAHIESLQHKLLMTQPMSCDDGFLAHQRHKGDLPARGFDDLCSPLATLINIISTYRVSFPVAPICLVLLKFQ
uniref:Uncharacterized protein n=1 Tax=Mycena chlorophos TaxID=658473 RepID=A0ABQ0L726_MYCCL|nr:predicted protein [Mycena chlorophos]